MGEERVSRGCIAGILIVLANLLVALELGMFIILRESGFTEHNVVVFTMASIASTFMGGGFCAWVVGMYEPINKANLGTANAVGSPKRSLEYSDKQSRD